MKRTGISRLVQKQVYQEADSRCSFCEETDVATLEIHHIDEDPGNNVIENLLLVCSSCHSKITHGIISMADSHTQKLKVHFESLNRTRRDEHGPKQTIAVSNSENSGIIANVVNLRGKKTPRMNYPVDAIGADTVKKSYIDYLYGRYIECRNADSSFGAHVHATRFYPGELHKTIQSRFKAKTFFVHVNRFGELVEYIQLRINATIQGKTNRAKGIPNYQEFEPFKAEQMGLPKR